jgi:hypothetical protein
MPLRIFLIFYDRRIFTATVFAPILYSHPHFSGHTGDVDLAVAVAHRQQLFLRIGYSSPIRLEPAPLHGNMEEAELAGCLGYWIFQDLVLCSTQYTTHKPQQNNGGEQQRQRVLMTN